MDNYEVIMLTSYDPNNSIFKSKANERSSYTIYSCCNCDNCDAFKRGKCIMRNGLWGEYCPYGKVHSEEGYTKRSKKCSSFVYDAQNLYKPQIKGENNLSTLNFTCGIGDYIYIDLPHLHNYMNSIDKKLEIEHEHFIPKEKFTLDLIGNLLNFHPEALFGGEITDYQKKSIPQFLLQLKRYFPDLYKEVINKYPNKEPKDVNYVGKCAKVTTLLPCNVSLFITLKQPIKWDGEKIIGDANLFSFTKLNKNTKVCIYPTDKDYVYILDNNCVTDDTVFKDE